MACVYLRIHVQLLFFFLVIISDFTLEGTTHFQRTATSNPPVAVGRKSNHYEVLTKAWVALTGMCIDLRPCTIT
jgi:hypothetical protein